MKIMIFTPVSYRSHLRKVWPLLYFEYFHIFNLSCTSTAPLWPPYFDYYLYYELFPSTRLLRPLFFNLFLQPSHIWTSSPKYSFGRSKVRGLKYRKGPKYENGQNTEKVELQLTHASLEFWVYKSVVWRKCLEKSFRECMHVWAINIWNCLPNIVQMCLILAVKHGSRTNELDLRYKCAFCIAFDVPVKSFRRTEQLQRHYHNHLEIRLYKCNVCEKRFKRTDHMRRHFRTQHPHQYHLIYEC